jgi:hypothetical protein
MYEASFAKMVFAYIAMQFVQEKIIDLDKPLYEYLKKPLPDYKIKGWNRGNDNGESIFKKLLAYSIGDIFTPWQWESYFPYNAKN